MFIILQPLDELSPNHSSESSSKKVKKPKVKNHYKQSIRKESDFEESATFSMMSKIAQHNVSNHQRNSRMYRDNEDAHKSMDDRKPSKLSSIKHMDTVFDPRANQKKQTAQNILQTNFNQNLNMRISLTGKPKDIRKMMYSPDLNVVRYQNQGIMDSKDMANQNLHFSKSKLLIMTLLATASDLYNSQVINSGTQSNMGVSQFVHKIVPNTQNSLQATINHLRQENEALKEQVEELKQDKHQLEENSKALLLFFR